MSSNNPRNHGAGNKQSGNRATTRPHRPASPSFGHRPPQNVFPNHNQLPHFSHGHSHGASRPSHSNHSPFRQHSPNSRYLSTSHSSIPYNHHSGIHFHQLQHIPPLINPNSSNIHPRELRPSFNSIQRPPFPPHQPPLPIFPPINAPYNITNDPRWTYPQNHMGSNDEYSSNDENSDEDIDR